MIIYSTIWCRHMLASPPLVPFQYYSTGPQKQKFALAVFFMVFRFIICMWCKLVILTACIFLYEYVDFSMQYLLPLCISDRGVHCDPMSLVASGSRCHTADYLKETKDAEECVP
jgi:hypothetical protein